VAPENFDIQRDNTGPEISFGHGIHHCLGVHLARLEMRIALQALLSRLSTKWQIEHSELRQNRLFRGPAALTLSL
jgi:cytochrome P450